MKGMIGCIAAALMVSSGSAHAQSAGADCASALSATGISSSAEGGRDFERYEGQAPPGLARQRAIENWQVQIASSCPRYSSKWWRARATRIDCEIAKGTEHCTATAQPARKLLSYLLAF
ncbi:MAG TPA: hypothetical protein PKD49_05535 [Hyphomicrobium sp.]|nr:hypothetical protein [Hyphomicrobium sp.]